MVIKTKIKKAAKPVSREDAIIAELFPDLLPAGISAQEVGITKDEVVEFDIIGLMNEAEDPDTGLLRDLKIDDRDLPQAKNYYDYAFNIIGKDANPPWLIQMWSSIMLFAEYCPCCSDKRWIDLGYIVDKVDKHTPSDLLAEHLCLLVNGKCPKCKRTKFELVQSHGLRNYQEFVNVLGQRSGKSSDAASKCSYLTHRYLKFPKLATLTRAMQKSTELTGTFVSLTFSKAEALLWTPYLNVINESSWFCVAEGTEVLLANGDERKIETLQPGDAVKTHESDAQPVLNVFDNGVKECFEVELENGQTVTATADHRFGVIRDGQLVWVRLSDLTTSDELVVDS